MTRVLVVDDSEPTREVMRDILEMAGFAVTEADSAERALELLGEEPGFEALVADIFLPGRNGIWLIREARANGLAARVVSVSGGGCIGGTDALEAARIAGADCVLRKPFSAASLMEAVKAPATAPMRAVAG